MAIVLVIKDMGDVHSVHLSSRPMVLGRSAACDVRISDEKVSGKHLALKLNAQGRVMIKDLESTNGTLLNGANITESYLMIADKLKIGDVELGLDDSQMTPREKKPLTRDDAPTQIKYIPMPGSTDANVKLPADMSAPLTAPVEPEEKTVVQAQQEKMAKIKKQTDSKGRLTHSAHKLSSDNASGKPAHQNKKVLDRENPTGVTQNLNVSDKNSSKKKNAGKNKKPKKKSFLEGVLQIFKRD